MKRILAILALFVCIRLCPAEADMEVHFLDVGQGERIWRSGHKKKP